MSDSTAKNGDSTATNDADQTPLQAAIREGLARTGLSQRQLAEAAGLGAGAVSDILNHPERQPRLSTLRALGVALGLGTNALVDVAAGRGTPAANGVLFGLVGPEEVAELPPLGAWGDFIRLLEEKGDRWAFYRVPRPAHSPTVAGGAPYDFVLVDHQAKPSTGSLALVDAAGLYFVGYLAEPYVVGQDEGGLLRHFLVDGRHTRLLGRVIFRTSFL